MMTALEKIFTKEQLEQQEADRVRLIENSRAERAREDEAERQKIQAEFEENKRRSEQEQQKQDTIRANKKAIVYSQALGFDLCRRIGSGEVLTVVCAEPTMPPIDVVLDWLEAAGDVELSAFQSDFEHAEKRRDRIFEDQLIEIADDSTNDYIDKYNSRTKEEMRVVDPENITRSKLRIDMRLRVLRARNPSKWGDNPQHAEVARRLQAQAPPQVVINMHRGHGRESEVKTIVSPDGNLLTIDLQPEQEPEERKAS